MRSGIEDRYNQLTVLPLSRNSPRFNARVTSPVTSPVTSLVTTLHHVYIPVLAELQIEQTKLRWHYKLYDMDAGKSQLYYSSEHALTVSSDPLRKKGTIAHSRGVLQLAFTSSVRGVSCAVLCTTGEGTNARANLDMKTVESPSQSFLFRISLH